MDDIWLVDLVDLEKQVKEVAEALKNVPEAMGLVKALKGVLEAIKDQLDRAGAVREPSGRPCSLVAGIDSPADLDLGELTIRLEEARSCGRERLLDFVKQAKEKSESLKRIIERGGEFHWRFPEVELTEDWRDGLGEPRSK